MTMPGPNPQGLDGTASLISGAVKTLHDASRNRFHKDCFMTMTRISPMTMTDHPEAMNLWRGTPGIGLSPADGPEAMRAYLLRNPDLSQCARIGAALVGTVLAGHDGRRGYLHHLCVHEGFRKLGIGRLLVSRALDALAAEGIDKAHAFLFTDNGTGKTFWESAGWVWRTDIGVVSRTIGEEGR